jgi:hypothetical protein
VFGVVADPVIVRFGLPERLSGAAEQAIGFPSAVPLPTPENIAEQMIGHGPKHDVDMIRHHDSRIEVIAFDMRQVPRLCD